MALSIGPNGIASTLVIPSPAFTNGLRIMPTGISDTRIGQHFLSMGYQIVVYINSVDVTDKVLWAGTSITDSLGNIKGLNIRVKEGTGAATGVSIVILDRRTSQRIFGGVIKEVTKRFRKKDWYEEEILAQDYTRAIDLVTEGVTGDYVLEEDLILQDLMSTYCPSISLQAITHHEVVTVSLNNSNLRSAIQAVADANGRVWYVDYNGVLHYFAPGDEQAPFDLSDSPDEVTTYKYMDLEYTEDVVNSEIRGSLKCWQPGLFAGMEIGITNDKLSWVNQHFLIYEVSATLIAGDMFTSPIYEYIISFGSRPRRVTDRIPPSDPGGDGGGGGIAQTEHRLSNLIIDVDKYWEDDTGPKGIYGMKFLELADWLKIPHGLDANKDPHPTHSMIYAATDTKKVYLCFEDDTWEEFGGGGGVTLNKYTGSTTANWQSGIGSSGVSGADLCNIAPASPCKLAGLLIDTNNLTAGGTIYVQFWQKINAIERMIYEVGFVVAADTKGLPVVNGAYPIDDYLRVEIYSTKSTDNGRAIGFQYWLEE